MDRDLLLSNQDDKSINIEIFDDDFDNDQKQSVGKTSQNLAFEYA